MASRAKYLAEILSAARYRRAAGRVRPSKLVAVVIPLSERQQFTSDEEVSLRHLERFLPGYDKYFIAPQGLRVSRPGYATRYFPRRYFGSALKHTKLVLSPGLYYAFRDYKFILIYHLDALVFSDRLREWCARDYDYIGAPWIKHPDAPYAGDPAYEDKVGNGGFCLRKVETFVKLLAARKYAVEPDEYAGRLMRNGSITSRVGRGTRNLFMRSPFFNNIRWELARLSHASEERFLANRATHYLPSFNFAPLAAALEFAFECVPRHCFELNRQRLPFGCHAWQKYDPKFWEPYLLKE